MEKKKTFTEIRYLRLDKSTLGVLKNAKAIYDKDFPNNVLLQAMSNSQFMKYMIRLGCNTFLKGKEIK